MANIIGGRCSWYDEAMVHGRLFAVWENGTATVCGDNGLLYQRPIDHLQLPETAEQPDELREAAEALLTLLTLDDLAGRLSGVEMDTRMAIVRLQEAMQ